MKSCLGSIVALIAVLCLVAVAVDVHYKYGEAAGLSALASVMAILYYWSKMGSE